MDQSLIRRPRSPAARAGSVFSWFAGIICYGLLIAVIVLIARQIIVRPPPHHVILLRNIPLPPALLEEDNKDAKSLDPGASQDFDGFGFQAIDPTTHLLFIAHSGPIPFNFAFENPDFHYDKPEDIARDGNILVFDLQKQEIVGRVPIPRVTGLVVAPDLHKVFAAGSEENRIYSFDELTLGNITHLQMDDYTDPDSLAYDRVSHKLFVAAPGAHTRDIVQVPGLDKPIIQENTNPETENVFVIDAPTLKILAKINIGKLPKLDEEDLTNGEKAVPLVEGNRPKFGYKVGHIKYNEVTNKVYLVTQISPDENDRSGPLPPNGTGELMTIDPDTYEIVNRTLLPESCNFPHALEIDSQHGIAYADCTEVDPDEPLVQHLIRVDLATMKVFPDDPFKTTLAAAPNMIVLDRPQQLVFVGCSGGITVFDVRPGHFHKLGSYVIGRNTSSIIVDEATQYIYLPVPGAGGRPTLHIAKYNPSGV
jgi:hypothetical protein